jgi:hypothetical protein
MNKIWMTIAFLAILLFGMFYLVPRLTNAYKTLPGIDSAVTNSDKNDSENFSDWKEFTPKSGLFKVMLPHPPQTAKDLVAIPGSDKKRRYDMYASEKIDGTLFLISAITYPHDVDTSLTDDILQQTLDELMKSNPDNRISKLKNNNFKTYRTLDFSLNNREFHVEGKILMVGKTVFVLSYITRNKSFNPNEYQKFIDSFELLNKESDKK